MAENTDYAAVVLACSPVWFRKTNVDGDFAAIVYADKLQSIMPMKPKDWAKVLAEK